MTTAEILRLFNVIFLKLFQFFNMKPESLIAPELFLFQEIRSRFKIKRGERTQETLVNNEYVMEKEKEKKMRKDGMKAIRKRRMGK